MDIIFIIIQIFSNTAFKILTEFNYTDISHIYAGIPNFMTRSIKGITIKHDLFNPFTPSIL